jgi:hypothetical protein
MSHEPISERDRAEVASLADGSLQAGRRAEVEARVARSSELQELLRHQRAAVSAVRAAAGPAPIGLRARIDARRPRRRPRGRRLAPALAAATVAAAVVLALLLPGGTEAPAVADAATLAARGSAGPPPSLYDREPELLARSVEGVRFPRWEDRFGWSAVGVRADRLDGRRAVTVFYERRDRRIAYTIVSGAALPVPGGGRSTTRAGTELRTLRLGGRAVVTWRRKGRTCVLSGAGVTSRALLRLASWRAAGKLAY